VDRGAWIDAGTVDEDTWQGEEEKGHGGIERREIRTVRDLEWLEEQEAWQDITTIVQYRTFRQEKGKERK
jgi:hypothetical protein